MFRLILLSSLFLAVAYAIPYQQYVEKFDPKIVNGSEANFLEFPSIVSLWIKSMKHLNLM